MLLVAHDSKKSTLHRFNSTDTKKKFEAGVGF